MCRSFFHFLWLAFRPRGKHIKAANTFCPRRIMVSLPEFHSGHLGSIPSGGIFPLTQLLLLEL